MYHVFLGFLFGELGSFIFVNLGCEPWYLRTYGYGFEVAHELEVGSSANGESLGKFGWTKTYVILSRCHPQMAILLKFVFFSFSGWYFLDHSWSFATFAAEVIPFCARQKGGGQGLPWLWWDHCTPYGPSIFWEIFCFGIAAHLGQAFWWHEDLSWAIEACVGDCP